MAEQNEAICIYSGGKFNSIHAASILGKLLQKKGLNNIHILCDTHIESFVLKLINDGNIHLITDNQKLQFLNDPFDLDIEDIIETTQIYSAAKLDHTKVKALAISIKKLIKTHNIKHFICNPGGDIIKRILVSVCEQLGVQLYIVRRANFENMSVGIIIDSENDNWITLEPEYRADERKKWIKSYIERFKAGKKETEYNPIIAKNIVTTSIDFIIRVEKRIRNTGFRLNYIPKIKKKYELLNRENLYTDVPVSDYVYMPLQWEEESNLTILGGAYNNQETAVKTVLNYLPDNKKLVLKEHPNRPGAIDYSTLNTLKQADNRIVLVEPQTPSKNLVQNCDCVITITSTVGFEALMIGKPVILLGDRFYKAFCETELSKLSDTSWKGNVTPSELIETFYKKLMFGYFTGVGPNKEIYTLKKLVAMAQVLDKLIMKNAEQ